MLLLLLTAIFHLATATAPSLCPESVALWPLPLKVECPSNATQMVSKDFNFTTDIANDVLSAAFTRYSRIIARQQGCKGSRCGGTGAATNIANVVLKRLAVRIDDGGLQARPDPLGGNESYSLTIEADAAQLHAPNVFGALRGLETFSQLVQPQFSAAGAATGLRIPATIAITDAPRFPLRGLLIDTARHFLPVGALLAAVDAMAYDKVRDSAPVSDSAPRAPLPVRGAPLTAGALSLLLPPPAPCGCSPTCCSGTWQTTTASPSPPGAVTRTATTAVTRTAARPLTSPSLPAFPPSGSRYPLLAARGSYGPGRTYSPQVQAALVHRPLFTHSWCNAHTNH